MNEKLSGQFSQNQIDFILKKKKHIWDDATITKSLKFRFALGRNGYQFLHSTGYPIPGYSTLNKKISNLQITFGLLNSLVEPLMAKIASMKN
jgi:hypothetical protein